MFTNINNYIKVYSYFTNNMNTQKNLILEPFCTLIKLILLSYKPKGTKISIYNNSIQFHEPSIIQGFLRIWTGDCREDLHNLYNPIIKIIQYCDRENVIHINLLRKCSDGLRELSNVYDNNTIINHTLLHYIDIVDKFIDLGVIDNSIQKTTPIIEGLKKFWNQKEIELVNNMFTHIDEKNENQEKIIYLKNIEDIINFKEKEVYEYISVKSTTYD